MLRHLPCGEPNVSSTDRARRQEIGKLKVALSCKRMTVERQTRPRQELCGLNGGINVRGYIYRVEDRFGANAGDDAGGAAELSCGSPDWSKRGCPARERAIRLRAWPQSGIARQLSRFCPLDTGTLRVRDGDVDAPYILMQINRRLRAPEAAGTHCRATPSASIPLCCHHSVSSPQWSLRGAR
jgi:hypothetical protein